MKWHRTAFKFEAIAKLMQEELEDEGIRTDFFTTGDGYYYVGWCPVGKEQYQKALEIVSSHID